MQPLKIAKPVKLAKVPMLPPPEPIVEYKTLTNDSASTLKLIKELKEVNRKMEHERS